LHETDIDERSINRRFNRLLKKYLLAMGVKENLNFHSARHTFAMLALKRGFDPYLLSKLLGYKTLAMVSVYSKISEAEKIEAVLAMNKE
jgi:site-specific recombinase XerD